MLLKNVDDVIKYLGRAVMAATTDAFLQPYIKAAQEQILCKILGPEIVEEVDTLYNGSAFGSANAPVKKLIEKMQYALAWAAYAKYLPFAIGNDGDNGLQEMATDSSKPVRIGVLDKRQREAQKNAADALQNLLEYINAPGVIFNTYRNSATYTESRKLFISNAVELSEILPQVRNNYGFFLTLLPYIKLAERDYVLPLIGQNQYNDLKAVIRTANITVAQKDLAWQISRVLAHQAYASAMPDLQKTILDNGSIRVLSDFDGIYNQKALSDEQLDKLVLEAKTSAQKMTNALQAFLRRNLSDYPAYANSLQAKEPAINRLPDNSTYKKTFRMK